MGTSANTPPINCNKDTICWWNICVRSPLGDGLRAVQQQEHHGGGALILPSSASPFLINNRLKLYWLLVRPLSTIFSPPSSVSLNHAITILPRSLSFSIFFAPTSLRSLPLHLYPIFFSLCPLVCLIDSIFLSHLPYYPLFLCPFRTSIEDREVGEQDTEVVSHWNQKRESFYHTTLTAHFDTIGVHAWETFGMAYSYID